MSRSLWALVMLAAGSAGAGATKLDKSTCNDLKVELASVVASGTRGDMERGPEWALANLPPEKIANIRRLIELDEQLEFRCGMGPSRIVSTSPADTSPAVRPDDKVVAPQGPMKKPQSKSNAARLAPTPVASQKPALNTKKPASPPVVTQKPAVNPKKPVLQKSASAAPADEIAAAAAAAAPAPASPKPPRHESSATYVSPADVNPFFVTRFGDAQ